jgi:hypothetical protein
MGVLWLFAGSRPVERVSDFARGTGLGLGPATCCGLSGKPRNSLGQRATQVSDVLRTRRKRHRQGHGPHLPMEVASSAAADLNQLVMFLLDATRPASAPAKFE